MLARVRALPVPQLALPVQVLPEPELLPRALPEREQRVRPPQARRRMRTSQTLLVPQ